MIDAYSVTPFLATDKDPLARDNKATLWETTGALLGEWSPFIENFTMMGDDMLDYDPDFDVVDAVGNLDESYSKYAFNLMFARSEDHFNYLVNRLDRSKARQDVLANSSIGNIIIASFFDPINLVSLPLGVGKTALQTGMNVAKFNVALSTAEEVIKSASDPVRRDPTMSALNIGTSGIAGFTLGSLAGLIKNRSAPQVVKTTTKETDELINKMSDSPADPSLVKNWYTDSWFFKFATSPFKRTMLNDEVPIEVKQFQYDIDGDLGQLHNAHVNGQTLGRSVHIDQPKYRAEFAVLYSKMLSAFGRAQSEGVIKFLDYPLGKQRKFDEFITRINEKRIDGLKGDNAIEEELINSLNIFAKKWENRLRDTGLIGTLDHFKKQKTFWAGVIKRNEGIIKGYEARSKSGRKLGLSKNEMKHLKRVQERLSMYKAHYDGILATIDDVELSQQTAGIKPPNETIFHPRYWKKDYIKKNRQDFYRILYDWFKENPEVIKWSPDNPIERIRASTRPEDIKERVNKTIDNILGMNDETSFENAFFGYGKSKHFMHRQLDIPNYLVKDFIETNPMTTFMAYTMKVAPRYSFAAKFGSRTFDDVAEDRFDDLIASGMSYDKANKVIADIRTSYDRVMNTPVREPHSTSAKTARIIKDFATLNYMGRVGFSSISELGRIMAEHGVGRTLRTILSRNDLKIKLAADEAAKAGEALEGALQSTSMRFSDEMFANPLYHSVWERGKDAFYVLNLLTPITKALKRLDGTIRQDSLISMAIKEHNPKLAKEFNLPKIKKWELEYLRRNNISSEDAKKLAFQKGTKWERGDSGLIYANTDEWTDLELQATFRESLSSGVLNTIMMGTSADRPRIADGVALIPMRVARQFGMKEDAKYKGYARIENQLLSLPFQFYGYTLANINKTIAAYTTGQMKSPIFGTMWMVGLAYLSLELKSQTSKGSERAWDSLSYTDQFIRAFDYSGAAAIYTDFFYQSIATSMALTGENYLEGFVKEKFPEEQGIGNALTGVGGAGPSILKDYYDGFVEMTTGDFGQGAKETIRALPYMRLWFIHGLVNNMTSALDDAIDEDGGFVGFGRY
tara:strand:+ start:336 stop:3578 length:3243 start_codon:yes stop_codon:yes gene_type:complete